MRTLKNDSKEIFVEGNGIAVTVNTWANHEGINLMVHGKDLSLRMAGAFRREEADAILVALAAARSA